MVRLSSKHALTKNYMFSKMLYLKKIALISVPLQNSAFCWAFHQTCVAHAAIVLKEEREQERILKTKQTDISPRSLSLLHLFCLCLMTLAVFECNFSFSKLRSKRFQFESKTFYAIVLPWITLLSQKTCLLNKYSTLASTLISAIRFDASRTNILHSIYT